MSRPFGFKHTEATKQKLRQQKLGARNPMFGIHRCGVSNANWKGGRRTLPSGYILIYQPNHPNADKDGCVMEHRLVMENHLQRLLRPEEVMHHKNGDVADNRIENLELFNGHSEHLKHHVELRKRRKDGTFMAA